MSPRVVLKARLDITNNDPISVIVANGEVLTTTTMCIDQPYEIQGHSFATTFRVLDVKGYDIIFGCDWILQHSPVTLNFHSRELSLHINGQLEVTLSDVSIPRGQTLVNSAHMGKLLSHNAVGAVLLVAPTQCHSLQTSSVTHPLVSSVLLQFLDVFAEPQHIPPERDCDHTIPLLPDSKPVNVRPYRLPHHKKNALEELIKQLLDSNVIQPSVSPFSSPAILVKKKDGSWRLCIDYRHLNAQTVKNKFPIPVIEDLLDELHGARYFSKIDLRSGYHQICMHPADIFKTAFSTHMGHFEYIVMPFGLTNAPATFQALMNRILSPYLRKFVLVFFDDILIFSQSIEDHAHHVQLVLQLLRKYNLFAKPSKCTFGQQHVEYLGYIISEQGVATDPAKIVAVQQWPSPLNVTQRRGFLGLAGYYRRFIKDFGIICRPLFNALKKNEFQWETDQQLAFQTIKDKLSQAPVLALPNFSLHFILETDASGYGIGAVLMQQGRPLAYLSKSLGPKAAGFSTYDKEAIAILEALKKWKHYFLASSLLIKTDQASLKYINEQKITDGTQHKLLIKLMSFDYKIEYKKGKENKAADALSRAPQQETLQAIIVIVPEWITQVLATYPADPKCKSLITKLSIHPTARPPFTLHSGILRYKDMIYVGKDTNLLQQQLKESFHSSPLGGHSGERATYQCLKLLFYWPGMKSDIATLVKECPTCQKNKFENKLPPGLLQPLPLPETAWTHITMDFIEGLPKSDNKDVIWVIVDRLLNTLTLLL